VDDYRNPIGIPTPSIGIYEASPQAPAQWPDSAAAGHYYIDNTHPAADDTDNSWGCPDRPRKTLPVWLSLAAGMVVDIRGNPALENGSYRLRITRDSANPPTAADPAFIRGDSLVNPAVLAGLELDIWGARYTILEYLVMDNTPVSIAQDSRYIAIRHCELKNAQANLIGIIPNEGQTVHDIVMYNLFFHDTDYPGGKWYSIMDADPDRHGVGLSLWQRSNAQLYNVWVLDSEFCHLSGDGVQPVGWKQFNEDKLHHIFIGRNLARWNRQAGFACKEASHVIVSQNRFHGGRSYWWYGYGTGINYQFGQNYLWLLFNEIWDSNYGIRQSTTDPLPDHKVYIIGNMIHDINPPPPQFYQVESYSPTYAFRPGVGVSLWYANKLQHYVLHNTIYNVYGGISTGVAGDAEVVLADNIISQIHPDDYHVSVTRDDTAAHTRLHHSLLYQYGDEGDGGRIRWGYWTYAYSIGRFQQAFAGQGQGLINADPRFLRPGENLLDLKGDSPAIDAGVLDQAYDEFQSLYGIDIRKDIAGRSRPAGAAWDIGCYEADAAE